LPQLRQNLLSDAVSSEVATISLSSRRERFLRFIIGGNQKLTILVPGGTVQELVICEIKKRGRDDEQD